MYIAEVVHDLPDLRQIEFDVPGGMGEVTLQVAVRPVGAEPWVGLFRTLKYSDVNVIQVWDDGPMLLAVAGGYPHFIDTRNPLRRVEMPVFPVRHILRHESSLVVLGDFVRMCGVLGTGVDWVSPTLADDWLDDVHLDGEDVVGRGSMNATGEWAPFRINVRDGTTETQWVDYV
ncbi:MAG: hypothetical protein ACRDGP_01770 [Actinomycetota bacterium]